jgi:hypothetical protein
LHFGIKKMRGLGSLMSDQILPPPFFDYLIVRSAAQAIEGPISELLHSLADDMETLSKMEQKPDFKFRLAAIKLSNDILREE